ncbi:uncharacterized protein CDAR_602621 [Caerostris darwini]|uniref:Uncharacterized protein n=1 Tax=Caerostris darwini TaxID=1538125 RepID=A0AAV4QI97_9ARAC|nr:uncharacterized protein CDAR_602621 [Caerostris darwini]
MQKVWKEGTQLSPTYSKDQNDPNPPQNRLLGRGSEVAIEEELFHGARFCGLLYLDGRVDAHILLRARLGGGLHEGLCGGGYDGDADGPAKEHAIHQKSKEATPDVIRYSSTPADDNFNPPAKFGSWGQLLSTGGKRQYSSLHASNPPPPISATTSTLPRVAGQRRQQQLYPAGLSSESESSGASPSSSDEDGDEDEEDEDEEENEGENHSDATTCTGSEMALAASKGEQQKDRRKGNF